MSLENEIQRWRKNYEQDMAAHFAQRRHIGLNVAKPQEFVLSAEDCVLLWSLGVQTWD